MSRFYYDEVFSDRRSWIIDKCIEFQKEGKSFLYILPSREAMKEVRQEILEKNKGIIGSNIIMFDELESMITEKYIKRDRIIDPNCEKVIIKTICEDHNMELAYFNKIRSKDGFQNEVRAFIKYLKRNLITEEYLNSIINDINDKILKKKLLDIGVIYHRYNKFLKGNCLYDVNDISIQAIEKSMDADFFNKLSLIVIDGFLNIDRVNQELIKAIVEKYHVDFIINCPYKTEYTNKFLANEMVSNFKNLNFTIDEEVFVKKDGVNKGTVELASKLFTSKKGEDKFEKLNIVEYPSIRAEVIDTAKKIKRLLMNGIKLNNIAVYINNKDSYEEDIQRVFSEYKIPINMACERPLVSYRLAKDLASSLKSLPLEFKIEEGLIEMQSYIDGVYSQVIKSFEKEDIAIINGLKDLVRMLNITFNSMNIIKENIAKEEFIKIFKDYLKEAKVTIERANRSGISIINTDLAKGIYFDYIFVLGLNEGEVPTVPKTVGLFNDLEIKLLRDNLIAYKDWNWELEREKIRFILTLASGKKEINLSFRNVNEEGKFAIQSPFIDAVKFITGKDSFEKITIRDYVDFPINNSMSVNELYKSLLKENINCKPYEVSSHVDYEKLDLYKEIGEVENIRKNSPDFTRFEGIITCHEYIQNHDKYISKLWFKDLEAYIKCPMGFMFNKLYNIDKYAENDQEEGINNLEKMIYYKASINEYYRKSSQFSELDEVLLNNILQTQSQELIKKLSKLDGNSEEVVKLESTTKDFIVDDIALRNKYSKVKDTVLKPYILDKYYSLEIQGISIGLVINRVELEYSHKGDQAVPTGRYIIYTYRNKSGNSITRDTIINLDTIEPALIYKAVEEVLKEKLPKVNLQCIASLYLGIEKKDRDGLYINDYSSSIFKRGKTKGCTEDKFKLLMEHGYKYAVRIINDMKNGVYNYNINCNEEKSFSDYKCGFMTLCRYYKSKGEVKNNV